VRIENPQKLLQPIPHEVPESGKSKAIFASCKKKPWERLGGCAYYAFAVQAEGIPYSARKFPGSLNKNPSFASQGTRA
jgi:hypothetical protein